jgi:hypothetical protein
VPVPSDVRRHLDELPETALVLDVGGWAAADMRADWVIDIGPWETRGYYHTHLGGGTPVKDSRATQETWVVRDISDSRPWPFGDNQFDYVICSHTLEDVRDPIHVCREIARVGKAGYIETPGPATELTRGIESPLWCGWHHHRWLVLPNHNHLSFLFKPHHIHSPFWPAVPTPKLLRSSAAAHMSLRWSGSFSADEEVRIDFADLNSRLREIVDSSIRRRSARTAVRRAEEFVWSNYRRARATVGGLARASLKR